MLRGLSTSLNGVLSGQTNLQITANNLANLTSAGFKAQRGHQVDSAGGGPRIAATPHNLSQGPLQIEAGSPFQLAIAGDGFFRVETGQGSRFTRNGSFHVNGEGNIIDSQGNRLSGVETLPENVRSVSIGTDGSVSGINANGDQVELGNIDVYRFRNPNGLVATGDLQYAVGAASGPPLAGVAGLDGAGSIVSGALEGSNVNLAGELTGQIIDARVVEANLAAIKVQDELLGEIVDLVE